jgi:hypothetical protein
MSDSHSPPIAATAVVPPHVGSGPLTVLQFQRAHVRIAVEMLTQVVQDLEASGAPVRQAALQALEAVVELAAALQAPS